MPGVTPISTATHNEEIVNTIQTAVLSKKTAYTTFVEASMRLEAVIPDETTRMKAAFVTVTGDGRSLEQVLQALDMHATDVDGEVLRCKRSLDAKRNDEVIRVRTMGSNLMETNKRLTEQVASLQQQIEKATQEINTNVVKLGELDNQAAKAESDINAFENSFVQAADYVKKTFVERKQMLAALMK